MNNRPGKRSRFTFTLIAPLLMLLFQGCSIDMNRYAANQPQLDLYRYFNGTTKGWGIVQDRKGQLLRQFVVAIEGTVNPAGELVLDETFHWSDGEVSQRTWTISRTGPNSFSGQAPDVIGEATGTTAGNVLNWSYLLDLPVGERTWSIRFDDWMFQQPDGILLNRAEMTKFGFRVGDITIAFMKPAVQED